MTDSPIFGYFDPSSLTELLSAYYHMTLTAPSLPNTFFAKLVRKLLVRMAGKKPNGPARCGFDYCVTCNI